VLLAAYWLCEHSQQCLLLLLLLLFFCAARLGHGAAEPVLL
jgi:hypothetical protein